MEWQIVFLLILATYGVTQTVTRYEGLFHIFDKLRRRTNGQLFELLTCPVCLGWYVSLVFVALAFLLVSSFSGVFLFLLVWLAVNGGSMLLNIWSDK